MLESDRVGDRKNSGSSDPSSEHKFSVVTKPRSCKNIYYLSTAWK